VREFEEWNPVNVVLWIVQALLAAVYVMAGCMKAFRPLEALSKRMGWVRAVPAGFVRFIGIAELLGAIGLILPMVTNVAPWLTVAAAAGLVLVQIGAGAVHLGRHEMREVPVNVVLLLLAVLVLIGRVAVVPVA
jgi:putative oxidoreductase